MFCGDCGELIQRYHERVRIERRPYHADCAVNFLLRLFPDLGSPSGRPRLQDDRHYRIETRGENNVRH